MEIARFAYLLFSVIMQCLLNIPVAFHRDRSFSLPNIRSQLEEGILQELLLAARRRSSSTGILLYSMCYYMEGFCAYFHSIRLHF